MIKLVVIREKGLIFIKYLIDCKIYEKIERRIQVA